MSKQINDLTEITSLSNDSLFEVEKPELYGGNYSAKIRGSSLMASIAGISSIRVNDQYRIEFTVSEEENETIVYICNILELSNHYK